MTTGHENSNEFFELFQFRVKSNIAIPLVGRSELENELQIMKWPVVKLKNEMTYAVHFYSSEKAQTFVNFIQMSKKGGFSTEVAQVIEDKRLTEVGFRSKHQKFFELCANGANSENNIIKMPILSIDIRTSESLVAEIPVA